MISKLNCKRSRLAVKARPASPVGLYSLRSPSPADPASGMPGLGHPVTIPRARDMERLAGAVGPASCLRRRYADAPVAALLTGLGVAG